MGFRLTRRTNDGYGWLAAGVSVLVWLAFAGGAAAVTMDGESDQVFLAAIAVVFTSLLVVFSIRQLVFPHEYELVVETDIVRWGRTDQPRSQSRVRMAYVRKWIIDQDEGRLFVDIGGIVLKEVGLEVLMDQRRVGELAAFLASYDAGVPVTDRNKV